MRIKSVDSIAAKFAARGSAASGDYTDGVKNPRRDWAEATQAGAENYAAGTQAAIAEGRFGKGVSKAGSEKWKRKAEVVGSQRFGQGITAAKGDYAAGVKPFVDELSNMTLPPRYPKGDPRNTQRVQAIADKLRAKKIAG